MVLSRAKLLFSSIMVSTWVADEVLDSSGVNSDSDGDAYFAEQDSDNEGGSKDHAEEDSYGEGNVTEAESYIEESSEESGGRGPTDHAVEVDSDTSCYDSDYDQQRPMKSRKRRRRPSSWKKNKH